MDEKTRQAWLRETREKQKQARTIPTVNATLTIPTSEPPSAPPEEAPKPRSVPQPTEAPAEKESNTPKRKATKRNTPVSEKLPENPLDAVAVYKAPKRRMTVGEAIQKLQGLIGEKQEAAAAKRAAVQAKKEKQKIDQKKDKATGAVSTAKKGRKQIPYKRLLQSIRYQAIPVLIVLSCISLIALAVVVLVPAIKSIDFSDHTPSTLRDAILEINEEQQAKITDICGAGSHDAVDLTGYLTDWRSTLCVFSVQEGLTEISPDMQISESQKATLRGVFRDLNQVSSEISKTAQGRTLTVWIDRKAPGDICDLYDFDAAQQDQLQMLLTSSDPAWQQLLYGLGDGGSSTMVATAIQLMEYSGNHAYWHRCGFDREDVSLFYVRYVAQETDSMEYLQGSTDYPSAVKAAQNAGCWAGRAYYPIAGSVIVLDMDHDAIGDKVGIVDYVLDDTVHLIAMDEDFCIYRSAEQLGALNVLGYCLMDQP